MEVMVADIVMGLTNLIRYPVKPVNPKMISKRAAAAKLPENCNRFLITYIISLQPVLYFECLFRVNISIGYTVSSDPSFNQRSVWVTFIENNRINTNCLSRSFETEMVNYIKYDG